MSEIVIVVTGQTGPTGGVGSTTLADLVDVTITAAASGDILRHNGTKWVDTPGTTHFEVAGAVAAHEADATDAHDASAISFAPTGSIAATDVQAAIAEVATDAAATYQPLDSDLTAIAALSTTPYGRALLALADAAALRTAGGLVIGTDVAAQSHVTAASAAHAASAISFAPTGTIAATDVQAAVAEVASEAVQASVLTTNGDVLTRAAGVPGRITRADLAADSAFSSRFVSLASARVWLTANEFTSLSGTPIMGTLGNATNAQSRTAAMLFDANTNEFVSASFIMPVGWQSFSTHIWWANAGAGSGDVGWVHYNNNFSADDDSNNGASGTFVATTAGAQYVLKRSSFSGTTSATAGQLVRINFGRNASSGSDTLTNDAGVVVIELVRAS